MLRLDHFVVHVDNDAASLCNLARQIGPLGFPFEAKKGKGTSGFKASNIWIGRQYFEIIRLLRTDGGGWTPHWVDRYNRGRRGLFCIFLLTDDISGVAHQLKARGLPVSAPERITFKALFGLIKKTLPWQLIYLPPIPNSDLEIGFIQYDPDPNDYVKQFMVPNADEHGITGVTSASVELPLTKDVSEFLLKIFPTANVENGSITSSLDGGCLRFSNGSVVKATLTASSDQPERFGQSFQLGNVCVRIGHM